jgi:hypothetical protein
MNTKIAVETQEQMKLLIEDLQSSTSQTYQTEGMRKHLRLSYETLGIIELEDGAGNFDSIFISIHDINMDGLGFLSRSRLIVGQKFVITLATELGEIEVPAIVIHSTETFGMFKIGVKFDLLDIKNN